jgi:hypothetical protein
MLTQSTSQFVHYDIVGKVKINRLRVRRYIPECASLRVAFKFFSGYNCDSVRNVTSLGDGGDWRSALGHDIEIRQLNVNLLRSLG